MIVLRASVLVLLAISKEKFFSSWGSKESQLNIVWQEYYCLHFTEGKRKPLKKSTITLFLDSTVVDSKI